MYRIHVFFICAMYAISSLIGTALAATRSVRTRDDDASKKTSGTGVFARATRRLAVQKNNGQNAKTLVRVATNNDADSSTTTVVSGDVTYHYAPMAVVRECARGYYATGPITFNGKTFYTACTKCPTYNSYDKEFGTVSYGNPSDTGEHWDLSSPLASATGCFIPKEVKSFSVNEGTTYKDGPYFIDDKGLFDFAEPCYKTE